MKIAIIGAENVSSSLGRVWAKAGHYIIFGVRNAPQMVAGRTNAPMPGIGVGTAIMPFLDAAMKADIVVLACPWPAVEGTIKALGDLSGKIVIDATNPLTLGGDGSLSLEVGSTSSGAEEIERMAAGSMVVKAFNTYGPENYADSAYPNAGGLKPVMFYCGDNDDAKAKVHQLAADLGFEPVDTGGLGMARSLEPLALLWIRLSIRDGRNPNFAWARLTRQAPGS
jgi:8-hydroxy-5-deazaflavin:NADPH oxidoreductase